jgi:pSer/pThr/pTyr-binding forkhead associated (FHA) protein
MRPRLVAVYGPISDWTIHLDEPVVSIRRQLSNDVCLYDPSVSRKHCLIMREGGQHVIEDLGSLNRIYVNYERVTHSKLKELSLI